MNMRLFNALALSTLCAVIVGCRTNHGDLSDTIETETVNETVPSVSLVQQLNQHPRQMGRHQFPPLPSFPIKERDWGITFRKKHPLLKHSEDKRALDRANDLLASYTPGQLKAMVPQQVAGFNWSRCFHCKTGDNTWGKNWNVQDRWAWEPTTPDTIVCKHCKKAFPNDEYKAKQRSYLNPAGETVFISYYQDDHGQEYFPGALIDSFKDEFCRRAVLALGLAYNATGEERYAESAIAIFAGYAETVPHFLTYGSRAWGTHRDNSGYLSSGGPYLRDGKLPEPKPEKPYGWQEGRGSAQSYWFSSLSRDHINAYDLVYKSKYFTGKRSPDGQTSFRFWIENSVFDNQAEFILSYPWKWQIKNNLARQIADLTNVAIVCGRPEYARFAKKWCEGLFYHYMNHHDMVTSEGPGYQYTWTKHIRNNFNTLGDYCDPAGYRDEDGQRIDGFEFSNMPFRVRQTMGPSMFRFPSGTIYTIGDTAVDKSDMRKPLLRSVNRIAPGFGLTTLGDGVGDQQVQAILNWSGGTHAHSHEDVNAILLYAKGRELISDPGKEWDSRSTFSHSTVIVDDKEAGRKIEPSGSLELFTPNLPGVSITRAESRMAAYPGICDRYRRTLINNTVDIAHPYVLDIFEVIGGKKHEYVLNGSHQKAHPQKGTTPLNLSPYSAPAPTNPEENRGWAGMSAMGITPLSKDSYVDFRFEDTASLGTRSHFQKDDSMELILGDMINFRFGKAHPYQRNVRSKMPKGHTAPKLILRHKGKKGLTSNFVLVHEVLNGESVIKGIQHEISQNGVLSVEVDLGSRKDYYAIALKEPTTLRSGPLKAKGLFAAAVTKGDTCDLWMAGAPEASCLGRALVSAQADYAGVVEKVARMQRGARCDAYLTDATLPVGDVLKNEIVMLEFFDKDGTWLFNLSSEIEEILGDGDKRWVCIRQDAGVLKTNDGIWQELFAPKRQAASCRLKVIASSTTVPVLDWAPRRPRYDSFDLSDFTVLDKSGGVQVSCMNGDNDITVSGHELSKKGKGALALVVDRPTQVSLCVANPDGVMQPRTERLNLLPSLASQPVVEEQLKPGLTWRHYKGMLEFEKPVTKNFIGKKEVAKALNNGGKRLPRRNSMTFDGYLYVPEGGRYRFYSRPYGAAMLSIDDITIMHHASISEDIERHVDVELDKGYHKIQFTYSMSNYTCRFRLDWSGPGIDKSAIPAKNLLHQPTKKK